MGVGSHLATLSLVCVPLTQHNKLTCIYKIYNGKKIKDCISILITCVIALKDIQTTPT